MQQPATVGGIEAGCGLVEGLRVQAPARKGAERARRLVGEDARAAAHGFLGRERQVIQVIADWIAGRPVPKLVR